MLVFYPFKGPVKYRKSFIFFLTVRKNKTGLEHLGKKLKPDSVPEKMRQQFDKEARLYTVNFEKKENKKLSKFLQDLYLKIKTLTENLPGQVFFTDVTLFL